MYARRNSRIQKSHQTKTIDDLKCGDHGQVIEVESRVHQNCGWFYAGSRLGMVPLDLPAVKQGMEISKSALYKMRGRLVFRSNQKQLKLQVQTLTDKKVTEEELQKRQILCRAGLLLVCPSKKSILLMRNINTINCIYGFKYPCSQEKNLDIHFDQWSMEELEDFTSQKWLSPLFFQYKPQLTGLEAQDKLSKIGELRLNQLLEDARAEIGKRRAMDQHDFNSGECKLRPFSIPKGAIASTREGWEDPMQTAIRELKEETGIDIRRYCQQQSIAPYKDGEISVGCGCCVAKYYFAVVEKEISLPTIKNRVENGEFVCVTSPAWDNIRQEKIGDIPKQDIQDFALDLHQRELEAKFGNLKLADDQ